MKEFDVSVLTEDKTVYEGKAVSLVVPAELGLMGILADHAPLVAKLLAGNIVLKTGMSSAPKIIISKGKGFIEVLKNKATLLLDVAE